MLEGKLSCITRQAVKRLGCKTFPKEVRRWSKWTPRQATISIQKLFDIFALLPSFFWLAWRCVLGTTGWPFKNYKCTGNKLVKLGIKKLIVFMRCKKGIS